MADGPQLKRSLFGVDPAEAERQLTEQVEPLRRERAVLERAVALAEAEAERLEAEHAELAQRIEHARRRLEVIRHGVLRQQSLASTQALAVHRQLAALEREHAARIDEARRREGRIRAEIEERRRSLHRWVMELLRSVAARHPSSTMRDS